MLIVEELIVIPTIPGPGSPNITSIGVGGRNDPLLDTLKIDGDTAASGFDFGSGLPTIKDASGTFGIGKLRGFPTKSPPLKNPVPGTAVGPNPKHSGGFGVTP
jgi:hypothetical protein